MKTVINLIRQADTTATGLTALPQVDSNLLATIFIAFVNYGDEICTEFYTKYNEERREKQAEAE